MTRNHHQLLIEACQDGREVSFAYEDALGHISQRCASPIKIDGSLMTAVCHLRRGLRTFRLERIEWVQDERAAQDLEQVARLLADASIEVDLDRDRYLVTLPPTVNTGRIEVRALTLDGALTKAYRIMAALNETASS